MFEYVNPKKKHRDIYKACLTKDRIVCFDGGVRCGKTTFAVMGFIDNLILNCESETPNSNNGLVVAKTLKLVRENVISIARSYLLEEYGIKLKSELDKFSFMFDNQQINIYTASADNISSQDSIQGMTIRVAFLDEAVLFPRIFIEQVFSRTDSFGNNAKIIMSTNPAGDTSHWYYKTYIKNADKYISITTEEAGIVDYETIEKNRKTLGEGTFKQRYLAQWVGANNDSAFPNFKVQYHEPITSYEKYIFIDWGSKDSVAVVEFSKYEDKHIVTDIFYHSRRVTGVQLISHELVSIVEKFYDNHKYILVDTAPDLVAQLAERGMPAKGLRSKSLASQYLRAKNLIDSQKLYFYRDIDPILEAQIKNAKMSKDGKSIGKVNNATVSEEQQIHALDCLVYYADRFFRKNGE
jgi:PBSX family phage terminase large subunit